ncbi:MAG: hypothetical protein MUF35_04395 [Candidatus Nanopelagicales bacterium]|jgi:hypothetical protein|nr:hypothetical protein [Candidatus Nanopelagicales bacterium]
MSTRLARLTGIVAATATTGTLLLAAPATAAPTATSTSSGVVAAAAPKAGERNPRVSRSMRGVRPSAYVGKYYKPRYERTRKCIVRKESGGNYRIASRSGTYKGAYQFNGALARATAKRMGRADLARRPMNTWSRFHQDKAFWIVWNNGRGARNWPTRHGC